MVKIKRNTYFLKVRRYELVLGWLVQNYLWQIFNSLKLDNFNFSASFSFDYV